jgi:hypothetical protein
MSQAIRLKKLRKHLPPGMEASRDGKRILVTGTDNGRPIQFRVDRSAGWEEQELAQYLASKVPVTTIKAI